MIRPPLPPLAIVLLVVLIDLIGFTLVMPLLPRYATQYGYSDLQIGLLLAAFPMCQLVAGPFLGRWSDRAGRRPVLAISQFGTAVSFLILGLATDYRVLLLARMLDGASGGNFLVAQAYVADITPPRDRAKNLGLIGAVFGVGFVLGPLLSGLLLKLPVAPEWRLRVPFLVAAAFSTLAWVLVWLWLPESLPAGASPRSAARVLSWRGVTDILTHPTWGLLVLVGSLTTLAFAALEGTFSLFLGQRFGWDADTAAFAFAFLGLASAAVQGGLIRALLPRFGEPRLVLVGLSSLSIGLVGMAIATAVPPLLGAGLLIALGTGLANPSIVGLLSRLTPETEQGAVFGVLASAQTLARMINYVTANRLLGGVGPAAPYWEGAAVAALALLVATAAVRRAASDLKALHQPAHAA
ncbi:MAG: tetracycline resistance MFS efflux pump [Isosphaeraceae bacterium]|nr:MAG: tetracycline resistance MFS efflux pump [Isosphaeraceae bacterium]